MPVRTSAEMQIADMSDAQAVELLRQARHLHLQLHQPQPAGLEDAPAEHGEKQRRQRDDDPDHRSPPSGDSNLASTGPIETTWRESSSRSGSRPAASAIICERWKIGMPNFFPCARSALFCQASSERWQSGQELTIASAPASSACSSGRASSASDVFSRASRIGKPQQSVLAG